MKGRTVTSWPTPGPPTLVSSRKAGDIPAFSAKVVEEFAEGRHEDMPQPSGTATA